MEAARESALAALILDEIRTAGPLTVARFMTVALYHPELGYYACAARRSGRTGDFFSSVDVGPIFGELLALQFAEMWRKGSGLSPRRFDLVEAGASDGRLARDVLDAAAAHDREFYAALHVHLVEASASARAAQRNVLGPHAPKLATSSAELPGDIEGAIFANELLDALPTHLVVMRPEGLREVYVGEERGRLVEREGPPSTPELERHLSWVGVALGTGWRAEVNLAAVEWVRAAGRRLRRGFLLVIDYGHEARELYSAAHASGTLTSFHRHTTEAGRRPERGGDPAWLADPGERDITAHVDLTSLRLAAEAEGLTALGMLDQTYFLLGLGVAERLEPSADAMTDLKKRLALKTLMLPGGLGSTHKVCIFARGVGAPALRGCSYRVRLT